MMFISTVLAQATVATQNEVATLKGLEGIFANALTAVFGAIGIALFIMLLIGGFKYLTSGGDPKAMESAKSTLTYAIIGIVLAACAYLFLAFVEYLTGFNVTVFRISAGP